MAVAELPFDLLEVKFAAPSIRPGTVAKADVITQLCTTNVPITSVVAPAGYGKTTLYARWAEADPRPFAWVALDARDNDAVVFLRYIAAALHQVEPLPSEVFRALSGPGGSIWSKHIPRVGTALAGLEQPLVLVLDDLHAVSNPSCLDVLSELVQYIPTGSKIAISTREHPALPLARWRAQGGVHEIGVADLRLDEQEANFLLDAVGVTLEARELAELTERTEGWPAGLYLAALSIQAGAPSHTGIKSFGGDDQFVAEYFRLELLDRLPADEATFLKHTSVLERLCGDLCDAVLETTRSGQTLEVLQHSNGFVVPLDRRGQWYRYHHLLRDLLRNELERSEPEIVTGLNKRAMTWCIDNAAPEGAVYYGRAAGEKSAVAGLLDALALPLYYDGRRETVEEWLGWFDEDDLRQYPALAVYGAWIRLLTGRPEEAARWLTLAEGATSAIPLSDGSATIEPWVATLRAHMMRNGVERALADSNLALEGFSPESGWIPVALLIRGVAHALLGANDRAVDDLTTTVEKGIAVGAVEAMFAAQAQLALLAAKQGSWLEAGQCARAAQTLVDETGLGDYAGSALVHVATARVALHEGRQEEARQALARAHRLRPLLDHGLPWVSIQVGLELSRVHLMLAEPGAAQTVLREVEGVLNLRPDMSTLVDEAQELRDRVTVTSSSEGAWAMSLSGAELRLLPYLATHLSFPEIGTRLFISRNTVKTEALAIYRKLGVSSRSEAIERAVEVGLLESSLPPRVNLIPEA